MYPFFIIFLYIASNKSTHLRLRKLTSVIHQEMKHKRKKGETNKLRVNNLSEYPYPEILHDAILAPAHGVWLTARPVGVLNHVVVGPLEEHVVCEGVQADPSILLDWKKRKTSWKCCII